MKKLIHLNTFLIKDIYRMNPLRKLLHNNKIIDVGDLKISRTSLGKKARYKERYLIYLPVNRNYLWKILNEKRTKVRIFLEILDNLNENSNDQDQSM
jgi:hypothetical protein